MLEMTHLKIKQFFLEMIIQKGKYSFYLHQWIPYQEAKYNRLKLYHDVKTYDGETYYNLRPNGNSFGITPDSDIEFIRLSRRQSLLGD